MSEDFSSVLITDCGSTTTKAILIEKVGDEYRQTYRGEAPTTVEKPFDDVTIGVRNAATEIEELSGRTLVGEEGLIHPEESKQRGVDRYLSTSSAGGGLQMSVAGVVRKMTAESAERAALGAGAIVMDVLSVDDKRQQHERIARLRHLRPDIVLLAGGTDGGTRTHVVELAETLVAADPRPRFGTGFRLPVIYAGNRDAAEEVSALLSRTADVHVVANVRPTLERENLQPARDAIHEMFLKHVMSHAPGYDRLMSWTHAPIEPTPAAVGNIIQTVSKEEDISIVGVDIGGATTDLFSVFEDPDLGENIFNRTVSANLGMSYSLGNVLLEAGVDNIIRWLPFAMPREEIRNRMRNKMIRPTTIPQTMEDLLLEQAVAREALRLAFGHHRFLAVGLKGVQVQGDISRTFDQKGSGQSLIDMMRLDMIVGSGGVLSHSPTRQQAALMMLDAFQPEGITSLAVDSIFMMPHLGVLSTVHPAAAAQVFRRDCLIHLGAAIAPVGRIKHPGDVIAQVEIIGDGSSRKEDIRAGEIRLLPCDPNAMPTILVTPGKHFDVGAGRGHPVERTIHGGVVGIILDGRGRPYTPPIDDPTEAARQNLDALQAFGIEI